jgi:asparagine synthetase B (glutamine-hydrolysing)
MRWIEIELASFAVRQHGFEMRPLGATSLYHSPGMGDMRRIEDLRDIEYAQFVIIDKARRSIQFGRDYLGHYPLSYALDKQYLHISDCYDWLFRALSSDGRRMQLSEPALALYFTMGFIPHGMSLYRDLVNCEATGYYEWSHANTEVVRRVDLFNPVWFSESDCIAGIGMAIDSEVRRIRSSGKRIDVWCSGGLDSSIMAMLFNAGGSQADLLTLAYGSDVHASLGDGERRFVREVGRFTGASIRDVDLAPGQFEALHDVFVTHHPGPVIDFPLVPKYALARATHELAVTGEAGDTFFGGTKNAGIAYAIHRQPTVSLGEHYATAHHRFFSHLPDIFRNGQALRQFAIDHCNRLVERYPGSVQRKLFYLNTHEKLASMIFAQSYVPSQLYGKQVCHPMASLGVYRAAFAVPDHRKFSYPSSKIALHELYGERLPPLIVRRRKSGTQLPLQHYLRLLDRSKFDFSLLANTGLVRNEVLDRLSSPDCLEQVSPMFLYAFVTLNLWLNHKEKRHAHSLPAQAHRIEPSAASSVI